MRTLSCCLTTSSRPSVHTTELPSLQADLVPSSPPGLPKGFSQRLVPFERNFGLYICLELVLLSWVFWVML